MDRLGLIGLRGTGKSSVGRELARLLEWAFVDADARLEELAGRSIGEIFAAEGERSFRDLESRVVAELAQLPRTVLALGGGAVLREENRRALAAVPLVWLRAPVAELARRISDDATTASRRPSLTGAPAAEELGRLLETRAPIYAACARWTVETQSRPLAEIAAEIVSLCRAELDQGGPT